MSERRTYTDEFKKQAVELLLSGRNINEVEAFELKIVDTIIPGKNLIEAAGSFAKHICNNYSRDNIDKYINEYFI